MTTIDWLKRAEHQSGGIAAWQDEGGGYHHSYPEVTGYLIPTLLREGEAELAKRCGDWLVSIQRPDGSWPGLDGRASRSFDTAAIVEGLLALGDYQEQTDKAIRWLLTQIRPDGTLSVVPGVDDTHIYTMRATWIMGHIDGVEAWLPDLPWDIKRWGERQRPHYIAYALEGLWHMGAEEQVIEALMEVRRHQRGLMPFWFKNAWVPAGGTCVCATAQFAYLYALAGLNAAEEMEAVRQYVADDGGVYHGHEDRRKTSWAAKYWLDALDAVG
jgi:malonyl-CoA O-methyltransferase